MIILKVKKVRGKILPTTASRQTVIRIQKTQETSSDSGGMLECAIIEKLLIYICQFLAQSQKILVLVRNLLEVCIF